MVEDGIYPDEQREFDYVNNIDQIKQLILL